MRNYIDSLKSIFALAPGKKLQVIELFISDMLYYLTTLLPPIATAGIIAVLSNQGEFSAIWIYVILYIIFYLAQCLALKWNYMMYVDLSHHYYNIIQQNLFEHIANNDSIISKIDRGKITDTCSEDISYVVYAVDATADVLTGFVLLAVIFCIFASINIIVAVIALVIDGLYLYLMNNNSRNIAKYYEGTRKYNDKIIDILNQMLGSLKQIKSLNMMPNLTKKLDRYRYCYDQHYDKKYSYISSRYCTLPMIVYIGKIMLYVFLSYLVLNNKMTLDKLVLLISYFEMVTSRTDNILEQSLNISHYIVRIKRIEHILSFKNESSDISYGDVDNDYINGVIRFDHVFYESKGKKILKNISFKALPNEITVIVGYPGAGKTTVMNLLYRLYRIKSGSILIDDESIYNYTKKVYSSNVSGVFQKSFIFKMSIKDNLSLIDPSLKHQIAALKRVGIYKDIERLPYGINTIIDEDDQILTNGQLRRLAIARALLTGAEVLLFDEVTANIDLVEVPGILEILSDLKDDHTIIVITHNPDIMKMGDQVIVLDKGRVSAFGRNTEVFEKSALYRELRTANFSHASENEDIVKQGGGYIDDGESTNVNHTKMV